LQQEPAPIARYFPEIIKALGELPAERFVLDGEIVIEGDFAALLQRPHPAASRVERLSLLTPASLVAFDVVVLGSDDLTDRPFTQQRATLERLLDGAPDPLSLTPITDDPCHALQWLDGAPASRASW
jgi:bifunctional non-homologous end joining protein LigD